jgi:cholesterol transport system auxiliary component
MEVSANLESTAVLYRLAYDDPFQLRPYAFARWSAPPGQLLALRLRAVLGRDRPVMADIAASALARRTGSVPLVLRVQLEEFSHRFDSASASTGVLRLRCSLLENTVAGERFVAQRSFDIERPAPSADAAGGVRALSAAADAAARDIAAWLDQH